MRTTTAWFLGLAALLLVACGVNAGALGSDADPEVPPAAVEPTAEPDLPDLRNEPAAEPSLEAKKGCGKALPEDLAAGKSTARTVTSGGRERGYRVYLPASATNERPLPLVLNFHGRGSTGEIQERYSGLVPVSEREGFVLVSPNGTGTPPGWAVGATPPGPVDDFAFVDDLLDELERELCLDSARVYAIGMSNGAFLASALGCFRGERIAAVASVAGVWIPAGPCDGPTPLIAFHGTKDGIVPFAAGSIRGAFPYPGARGLIASWAANNGCEGTARSDRLSARVLRESQTNCEAETVLMVVEGDGHTWPGASEMPAMGATTRELSAAEAAWQFFARQTLRN